ncbi:glutamine--tRNA ligase/YqeY domain fusion protein [Leptothrix ochracea]|uniref:glutamine--tRNA ligase/YqeY domain fusion protein n=1 Tax=Leptothrix ochracea TaxID=735331 RepID=UPI0034E1F385
MSDHRTPPTTPIPSNFLRNIIERDLQQGLYATKHHAGSPGDARHHAAGPLDPARIRTRFPPEPNGYLHIGHAKSICLNFGLARDYGGVCHMRFDDTNPEKESQEFVDSILDAVSWLGFGWHSELGGQSQDHLYFASNYFDTMYAAAEFLIQGGHAYVDEQTPEQIRAGRGTLTEAGTDSPYRNRSRAENLARFRAMRDGAFEDGAMVLRARIDMAAPNINLRDPAIYRIRRAHHHNTGNRWCIYPMYTFAHPIEDALEGITHSICTLEFEDQRPFYDWLLTRLSESITPPITTPEGTELPALLTAPLPRQYEFARLNLSYVVTSKRKLKALVDDGHVQGWDDPRLPTLVGLRRRGYTPESIQLFCERIGVSKADSWIDYSSLEIALRDDLDAKAARCMAVLDPVELVLGNWAEIYSAEHREPCSAPSHPSHPEMGQRAFTLGPRLWIERDDFMEAPSKGYHRLYPGNKVRLKYGFVVECTGCEKDASGQIVRVLANIVPDTRSGTPGAENIKVKGVITWVGADDGVAAEVRLFDRLYTQAQPEAGGADHLASLNPNSKRVVQGWVEPSLAQAPAGSAFQFERLGYFVADRLDHQPGLKAVFNRTTTLRDSWGK